MWSVTPQTLNATDILHDLEGVDGIDFWTQLNKISKPTKIIVSPEKESMFASILNNVDVKKELIVENLEP